MIQERIIQIFCNDIQERYVSKLPIDNNDSIRKLIFCDNVFGDFISKLQGLAGDDELSQLKLVDIKPLIDLVENTRSKAF